MTPQESVRYWSEMRKAMEVAGDTSSAIYRRALAISSGQPDPLAADLEVRE
jgi:hypothetical protein